MKALLKLTLLFSLLAAVATSCSDDDDYSLDRVVIRYGVIEGSNANYSIKCDDGSILRVSVNLVPQIPVKDGKRVIINYTPLGRVEGASRPEYLIRLNMLYDVLSKGPVKQSEINAAADPDAREAEIGKDPIHVVEAWFGGEYLNINFEVERYYGSGIAHFINLVFDDTKDNIADEVHVRLRHNGYDDIPKPGMPATYSSFGRVSFKISSLLPEDKESIKLFLHWTEFGNSIDERVEKEDSGIFTPYGSGLSSPKSAGALKTKVSEVKFDADKIATSVE